jgi:hypothetical protein
MSVDPKKGMGTKSRNVTGWVLCVYGLFVERCMGYDHWPLPTGKKTGRLPHSSGREILLFATLSPCFPLTLPAAWCTFFDSSGLGCQFGGARSVGGLADFGGWGGTPCGLEVDGARTAFGKVGEESFTAQARARGGGEVWPVEVSVRGFPRPFPGRPGWKVNPSR